MEPQCRFLHKKALFLRKFRNFIPKSYKMANKKTLSGPIVLSSFFAILAGEFVLAAYTDKMPGAIIGTALGVFFGPFATTIGCALGMAIQTLIQ